MILSGAILFTNWTDADFTHTWNNVPYRIPKGQSIMLETGIAETFTKHLVDRELHKMKKPLTDETRESLERKCIAGNEAIVEADGEKLKTDIVNSNAKSGTTAGASEKAEKADEDEGEDEKEFPDLKK